MKSRLAMLAMLVSGLLLSGTGATLAVSGGDNAAQSQYAAPQVVPPGTPPKSDVLPETESGGNKPATEKPSTPAKSDTEPATSAPAAREQGAEPAAQVAANDTEDLPFTGFAAVPILLGGVALMAGGLVMRRRTSA